MNRKLYWTVFKELVVADCTVFKQLFLDKFINLIIWVALTLFVMTYIMPYFGLQNFGLFQLGGLIAAIGIFELYGSVVNLVSDFESDRIIDYTLTLPIPSWLTLLSKATYFFIMYFILSILIIPVGKLCLWNQFDASHISYSKLLLILIIQNIFYAFSTLWAASIVPNMQKIETVWAKIIFPLWFLGGFNFSWIALYRVTPSFACINLLNPLVYINEAVRVTLIGQAEYINFWLCLLALSLFSLLCLFMGFRNLKKRLDFV